MNIINNNLKKSKPYEASLQLRNTTNNARTPMTLSPSQKYTNALINLREGLNEFKYLDDNNFNNANNNNTFQFGRLTTFPNTLTRYNHHRKDNSQTKNYIRKNSEKNSSKKINTFFFC